MRYITQVLEESFQFYNKLIDRGVYTDFLRTLDVQIRNLDHPISQQEAFAKFVRERLSDDLLFAKEFKEIVLNDDGSFRFIDEETLAKLAKLANKCYEIHQNNMSIVDNHAREIIKQNYTEGINELAKLRFHDDPIMSVHMVGNQLVMKATHVCKLVTLTFSLTDDIDKSIFSCLGYEIIYEELFVNEDNTFEYNALCNLLFIKKPAEFSIKFTTVQIDKIEISSEEFRTLYFASWESLPDDEKQRIHQKVYEIDKLREENKKRHADYDLKRKE